MTKAGAGCRNKFIRANSVHRSKREISFWSFAKRRLSKFNGLTDEKFILYLKESEVRFDYIKDNVQLLLERLFSIKKY